MRYIGYRLSDSYVTVLINAFHIGVVPVSGDFHLANILRLVRAFIHAREIMRASLLFTYSLYRVAKPRRLETILCLRELALEIF